MPMRARIQNAVSLRAVALLAPFRRAAALGAFLQESVLPIKEIFGSSKNSATQRATEGQQKGEEDEL